MKKEILTTDEHGLTRRGGLQEGWDKKKLYELFTVRPPKKLAKDKLENDDEISFVPMECLNIDNRNLTLKYIKQLKDVYSGYTYFKDNDVLLAKITPCFENGKVGIAQDLVNGIGFGSSEFIVFRPNGKIIPEYLYYYLSQESFRDEGKNRMAGAVGHKRVSKDFIKNYILPYPNSLEVQKRIVKILDKAFAAIDIAKANAEKNLANAKELFDSYLNRIFVNPGEDWEQRSFGDSNLLQIIDGDRGKNYPKKKNFLPAGHCLFMNTKNVRPHGFDFTEKMFISAEKDAAMGKGKIFRNDVVMTTRGTIGNIGIFNKKVPYDNIRINSGMLIFRPNNEEILSEYLFEILHSATMKKQIDKHVSGAAQPQLPIKTLVKFSLPVPKSLEKQKEIVAINKQFIAETSQLETIFKRKLSSLAELKSSILKKAFGGDL